MDLGAISNTEEHALLQKKSKLLHSESNFTLNKREPKITSVTKFPILKAGQSLR